MKSKTKLILLEIISLLLVVLFVYAAANKMMDYTRFKVQLEQSPILRDLAYLVAWSIPALEIIIVFLLVIPKYRLLGLYASFFLMVLFTTYLIIILNFFESKDIPCSCGGILNKLGWKTHIYFNLFFIIISAIGITISSYTKKNKFYLTG
ncbi:MAG: MauE/DoxX family redox-associated membrane protein [Algibacter sp.]